MLVCLQPAYLRAGAHLPEEDIPTQARGGDGLPGRAKRVIPVRDVGTERARRAWDDRDQHGPVTANSLPRIEVASIAPGDVQSAKSSELADAVEDFAEGAYKELPFYAVAQAVFALTYAHRKVDLIPDLIPNVGRADDSSVVRAVLIQNEKAFAQYAATQGLSWSKITSRP